MAENDTTNPNPANPEDAKPSEQVAAVELVRMYRNAEEGQPATADVHPDEVDNYSAAGWSTEKPTAGKRR